MAHGWQAPERGTLVTATQKCDTFYGSKNGVNIEKHVKIMSIFGLLVESNVVSHRI
jgi:hypothetical protein